VAELFALHAPKYGDAAPRAEPQPRARGGAGAGRGRGPVGEITVDDLREVYETNVFGVVRVSQAPLVSYSMRKPSFKVTW
jgi:hypothetical protein